MPIRPRKEGDETVYTSHASKKSKINLWLFEAPTSVLVPLLMIPVLPFGTTLKISLAAVILLVVLERRGLTVWGALKRLRTKLAGRFRYSRTRHAMRRRSGKR